MRATPDRLRREAWGVALLVGVAIASFPATAHATDMSGLAVLVLGMVVGIPAIVLLVAAIIGLVAFGASKRPARWHATFAHVVYFAAPALALAFPLSMVPMEPKFLDVTLVLDLPAIGLGVAALLLARRLRRRTHDALAG